MLYEQISRDLAPFTSRRGITKTLVDMALARWPENGITAAVGIYNGSMYMLRPRTPTGEFAEHSDGQLLSTLRQVRQLVDEHEKLGLPPLPDAEFVVNGDDYGRARASDRPLLPLLSITRKVGVGADILYPSGHYAVAGKAVSAIGEDTAAYRSPWHAKREVALFRGRPNSHSRSRFALARLAVEGDRKQRALFDIGFVFYIARFDPFIKDIPEAMRAAVRPLPTLPVMTMADHLRTKYLLNLDGHSYANRLIRLLATNSLVLKEESAEIEFYYHLLTPHVHYVPFDVHLPNRGPSATMVLSNVVTNLSAAVEAARRNDQRMRRIAEQAHALAHTHLCLAAQRCYLHALLTAYGSAMAYRPTPRPEAVRVTNEAQLWRTEPKVKPK